MNSPVDHAALALSLYETACETHKRQDWRLACHALAKSLKQSLAGSAAMPAPPAPATAEAVQVAAPAVRAKAKAPAKAKAAPQLDMTAGGLTRALRGICSVVEKWFAQSCEICTQVRIVADGRTLTLTGTDLDMEVTATIEAPGCGTWQATTGAHDLLAKLCKLDPATPVVLSAREGDGVLISLPRAQMSAPGFKPADFPMFRESSLMGDSVNFLMSRHDLTEGLVFTNECMSREETRYYLNGLYLHMVQVDGESRLRMTSTDGNRLACYDIPAPALVGPAALLTPYVEGREQAGGVIVPRKTVSVLKSLAIYGPDGIECDVFAIACVFTCGPFTIKTKVVDGSFPDYQRVIPRDNKRVATFNAAGLWEALKGYNVKGNIKMAFDASGVALTQGNAITGDLIESRFELHYEGEPIEAGFNLAYLRDCLTPYGEGLLSMAMDGNTTVVQSPVLIRPVQGVGTTARLNVIMPLRV